MSAIGDKLRALASDVDRSNIVAIGIIIADGSLDLVLSTADFSRFENHPMMLAYAMYQATVLKQQEAFLQ